MKLDVARLSITLQGGSGALGLQVSGRLEAALKQALSDVRLRGTAGAAQLDLGVIDAPAHADAQLIGELVAARLVEWIGREPGDPQGEGR